MQVAANCTNCYKAAYTNSQSKYNMLWNALNCPVCLIALCAMFRQGRTAKRNQQSHVRMIAGALVRLDDYCSRALTMVQTYSAKTG